MDQGRVLWLLLNSIKMGVMWYFKMANILNFVAVLFSERNTFVTFKVDEEVGCNLKSKWYCKGLGFHPVVEETSFAAELEGKLNRWFRNQIPTLML